MEEQWVAAAFAEVLGHDAVGRNDNFFFLGGDSLKGMRVLARIRPHLSREIPVTTLFRYPTPALLGLELSRMQEAEDELDALAGELLNLPPDEVARLLAEGSNDSKKE